MTVSSHDSSNNARSGRDALPGLHGHLPFGPEHHIDARAEFDQADAFGRIDNVAGFFVANDAARDQSGDLFENHRVRRPPTTPSTVMTFCSLAWLASSLLATRNWPFL